MTSSDVSRREHRLRRYYSAKERGLCVYCASRPSLDGRTKCAACLERVMADYYRRKRGAILAASAKEARASISLDRDQTHDMGARKQ